MGRPVLTSQRRDWLSREDYRSLALRLNSTEFTVRSAFQLLRARLRKSLAKASGTVVRKHSLADPTPTPSSTEVLLQSIAASRQHDQGLSQQLQLLVSPASQGGLAQASFAPLLVALMTSARTPALKATLAEVAAASGGCPGAPQALAEAGALAAVAGWLVEAERDGHTTLLRKYLATARALPVSSAAQAGVLARPLQKCRGYALAQDVGEQATQLLVHWSRALGPLGHAVAGPPAAPAAMLPLQPFIGPPMSRSGIQALATRLAQPALVTMRSAEDRLAGVNERAAARPLSVDELLKKKRLAAQSAGGLLGPGYKRPRAGAATPALPAHLRQQQPQPHAQPPTQIQWAPPPMVSVPDCDYGVDSHEVAIQLARQADTPPVCYLLASLVPDDPATPLEVEAEARAAEGVPVPFIPDLPTDPEDAERQRAKAGLLLQPQPGWTWPPWGGLAPPPAGS